MNSIMVIHPYKYCGAWVFDDESKELFREAFVSGADDMIEKMTSDIPNAESGFRLYFSTNPFPGFQLQLYWIANELGGNWYGSESLGMKCWLCPSLMKYFDEAPQFIYAQFKELKESK